MSLIVLAVIGIAFLVISLKGKAKDRKTLKQLQTLIVQDAENHSLHLSDTFIYHMGGLYVALDQASRKLIYRLLPDEAKVLDFGDIKSFSIQDRMDEWKELIHQLTQSSSRSGSGSAVAGTLIGGAMGAGIVASKGRDAQQPASEMSSQEIEARLKGQSFLTVLLHLNSGETVTFPMMVHGAHSWSDKYLEDAQDDFKTLYSLLKKNFPYGAVQP